MSAPKNSAPKREFGIRFGALAPSLWAQIHEQGLTADRDAVRVMEADANAIARLYVRGLLSDGEKKRAQKRLMKRLSSAVRPVAEGSR